MATLQERLDRFDEELITLAKPILVLKYLNWPDSVEQTFLERWQAGRPALPEVKYQIPPLKGPIAALDDFVAKCKENTPAHQFIRRTAWSYAEAGRMLMVAGTPEFTRHSLALYGGPSDVYGTQSFTGIEAATFLLKTTDNLLQGDFIEPCRAEVSAEVFAERLQRAIDEYFADDRVKVVVDDALSSKAIAGTSRIRIRSTAMFSDLDFDQLYYHEALVHTATAVNGRRQPHLKSLKLGAPRTTRTQEGIAVFAEIATRSIDIKRLRRIALRILALKMALNGADFIDCFRFFLESGDEEREAYKSAQRIFRGGDVRGGVVFTKDSVYLKGLMEMHVFLNVAIRDNQPQVIERLFAGRLTIADAITLAPCFEEGVIERPRYVPPWAVDTRRLAAQLAYSSFMMNVNLGPVSFENFVQAANRSEVD